MGRMIQRYGAAFSFHPGLVCDEESSLMMEFSLVTESNELVNSQKVLCNL